MKLSSERIGTATAVVTAAALTVVILAARSAHVESSAKGAAVESVHASLEALQDAMAAVLDAESAKRGFLLTGDVSFLAPAADAKPRFEAAMTRVVESAGPPGSPDLPQTGPFADYARQRFTVIDEAVSLCRAGQAEEAVLLARSHRGRAAMANVRDAFATLVDERRATILRRRNDAEQAAEGALLVVNAVGFLIGGTFLVALLMIRRDLMRRRQATAFLRDLTRTDPLTRLTNRTTFDERLRSARERVRDGALPFTLVLADIDRFKHVNDDYGHPVGDDVLRWAANRIRDLVRDGDVAARVGGEEFGILLADVGPAEAAGVVERLRFRFAEQPFLGRDMDAAPLLLNVTLSFGAVCVTADDYGTDANALYARADAALYAAKNAGRNRVEFAGSAPMPVPTRAPSPTPTATAPKGPTAERRSRR